MKTTKTIFHIFDASAFDEELGLLNEMSEQGWQLKDMGLLSQKYVYDDSTVYRYAIDYQRDLSLGEFKIYRSEFEEQGWSFVIRRGSWYVFRRIYDPALPEESYLLYTDEPSFLDMKRSVPMMVYLWGFFSLLNLLIIGPSMAIFLETAAVLLVCIISFMRRRRFLHVRCVPKKYRFHLGGFAYVLVILPLILTFVFIDAQTAMEDVRTPEPSVDAQSVEFTVKLPDLYGIWVKAIEPNATEVPYSITDEDGKVVSSGVLSVSDAERYNCFFWPGTYTLTVDWGSGPDITGRSAGIGNTSPLMELPLWVDIAWIFVLGAAAMIVYKRERGYRT